MTYTRNTQQKNTYSDTIKHISIKNNMNSTIYVDKFTPDDCELITQTRNEWENGTYEQFITVLMKAEDPQYNHAFQYLFETTSYTILDDEYRKLITNAYIVGRRDIIKFLIDMNENIASFIGISGQYRVIEYSPIHVQSLDVLVEYLTDNPTSQRDEIMSLVEETFSKGEYFPLSYGLYPVEMVIIEHRDV